MSERRPLDPNDMRQLSLPGLQPPPRRVLASPGEQALACAHLRLGFFAGLFLLIFGIIGARLIYLAVHEPQEKAKIRPNLAAGVGRAEILDRNGAVLATSVPTFSACLQTKHVKDPDKAAAAISRVLPELNPERLADSLRRRKGCAPLKRHLTPRQYDELNDLGIGALDFTRDERRVYPQGDAATHVVGATDPDNRGMVGVERSFDERLRENPEPLKLSLDIRVQHILRHRLQRAVTDFQALGGGGVVMDVQTGAVLALVSLPDYDPQQIGTASAAARFNHMTLGVYELGSTFKLLTAAQALELGVIDMKEKINAIDPIRIGRHKISDFHPEKRWLSLPEIIMVSSNIGAAHLAERIGGERQRSFLQQSGLLQKPRIELPEVGRPIIPENWSRVTTMTVGFGHGIAAAPLQLVESVAMIANGGRPVQSTLLLEQDKPSTAAPVLSATTVNKMRAIMRLVTAAGTAKAANAEGYLVGGKTGTAEKITDRGYSKDARLSSFIGVFPLNNPRYVVFAMLDEPKGNKSTFGFATGGWVAAPVVGDVITASAPLLGVNPIDGVSAAAADSRILQPVGQELINKLIKPEKAPRDEDPEPIAGQN
jgi:cell division protein FtsI (penicillin-binding protein 3)